jgi:hypothetical protein
MTFLLKDTSNGNTRECGTRAEAEEKKNDLVALGADPQHIEIVPEGEDASDIPNDAEVVDHTDHPDPDAESATEADGGPELVESNGVDLPDSPPMDTDPLSWIPTDFVDTIDGQPAINRKGFDVLAHHYDISVTTEVRVSPNETGHEYAEVRAVATTAEGIEYAAHGSASVGRGDDSYLLLEMADTRAAKRATSRATGVGMIAAEELKNDL